MNAVVLTVKASYVASTKYRKTEEQLASKNPVVVWKMKARELKPFRFSINTTVILIFYLSYEVGRGLVCNILILPKKT